MNENTNNAADIFRLLNREVWLVTSASGQRRGGLAATYVSQASIDAKHPVVVVGIAPNHFTAELIDESEAFALHLVTPSQTDLVWNFALGSGRARDKFVDIDHAIGETGCPILTDCLASLECKVYARLATGDRTFYWADVINATQPSNDTPLCERELFAAATDEQKKALIADRDSDIEIQRNLARAWRAELPTWLKSSR